MTYFKFLKYETRRKEEKKQIEEALVEKLAKWKYSSSELTNQVPVIILNKIVPCCKNAINISQDMREQTLRKVMEKLSDKEVKEALTKHEQKLTRKFNAILTFLNYIEYIVQ